MSFCPIDSKPLTVALMLLLLSATWLSAGTYTESAHGDSVAGVNRQATSTEGYARGNCGHCHEQHASINNQEPVPVGGSPSGYLLLSDQSSDKTVNPYSQADNVCFNCHSSTGSVQQGSFTNKNFSSTFGGASTTITSIMDAFNQSSYHNLYDVRRLITGQSGTKSFADLPADSSPCSGCHNVHMAKRNRETPGDPTNTAISKPSDHNNLFGNDSPGERMTNPDYGGDYQPPKYFSSGNLEPDGLGSDQTMQASKTPDYSEFCTDCHNPTSTIYSSTLGRYLKKIDWGIGGDKHGAQLTDGHDFVAAGHIITPRIGGGGLIQAPYVIGDDYILSCLDCHEPHGSNNIMLLRPRVNGGDLDISITAPDVKIGLNNPNIDDIGYLCLRCHYDDKAVPAFNQTVNNHWRFVHHADSIGWDTPYGGLNGNCSCHAWPGTGMGRPLCGDCHFHGSVITIDIGNQAGQPDSTRKTF